MNNNFYPPAKFLFFISRIKKTSKLARKLFVQTKVKVPLREVEETNFPAFELLTRISYSAEILQANSFYAELLNLQKILIME